MTAAFLLLLLALVAIGLFVWWLLVLIEAVKTPTYQWVEIGQNQIVHVLLMVFLGLIGTVIFVLVARPKLHAAGYR